MMPLSMAFEHSVDKQKVVGDSLNMMNGIPNKGTIQQQHRTDLDWNRMKSHTFLECLAPEIDARAQTYYQRPDRTSMNWFKGDSTDYNLSLRLDPFAWRGFI